MYDLHKNSQIYTMVAEGEVANILSHFDSDYVMRVIKDNLENRFSYFDTLSKPNVVASFDLNFKDMLKNYPGDGPNIASVRQETYKEVIETICNFYQLTFVYPDPNLDLYSIAYYMYDFFVARYAFFVSEFFSKFILLNKDSIYEALDLQRYKKDKDNTTMYIKKALDDGKIGIIISKINEVLYYLSGMDIDLHSFLLSSYDQATAEYMSSLIYNDYFYKQHVCSVINIPSMVTDIRLRIHNTVIAEMAMRQAEEEVRAAAMAPSQPEQETTEEETPSNNYIPEPEEV